MRRVAVAIVAAATAVVAGAWPAVAASPDEVVRSVSERGYYVEDGAADPSVLSSLVSETGRIGLRYVPVALASAPESGATAFADAVLDELGGGGTVVVVAPSELGYSSTEVSRSTMEAAADRSVADFRRDTTQGFVSFARAIVRRPAARTSPRVGIPFGGLFFLLFLLAPFLLFFSRMRRVTGVSEEQMTEGAQHELRRQMDALADGIVELSDRVSVEGSPEAKRHFREASATYADAESQLRASTTFEDLEALSDRLDRARWQLEATRSTLEGRPVPAYEPESPAACFFDPSHGAGVEEATIEVPDGTAAVRICRNCAERLRAGDVPEPALVSMSGHDVPLAAAPRSYGGLGIGIAGPFAIMLPGLGATMLNWGTGGFFGMGGGMFGGGMFGGGMFGGGGRYRGGSGMGRARGGRSFGGRARGGRGL